MVLAVPGLHVRAREAVESDGRNVSFDSFDSTSIWIKFVVGSSRVQKYFHPERSIN